MDYDKIYKSLISKAKLRNIKLDYFENHHIMPTSLGGTDDPENIVKLTYREHYLAHWLLLKIAKTHEEKYKMGCAFFVMSKSNNGLRNTNSRLYARAKKLFKHGFSNFIKTEEGKVFLKDRARKRIEASQQKFIFHFYHTEHGDFCVATNVLMDMFPEQNLNSSNLVKVGKGERASHKGWILHSNKDIGITGLLLSKKNRMSNSAKNRFNDEKYVYEHSLFSSKGGKAQKGFKKHYHENGDFKMAKPNTEKSIKLLEQGYYLKGE